MEAALTSKAHEFLYAHLPNSCQNDSITFQLDDRYQNKPVYRRFCVSVYIGFSHALICALKSEYPGYPQISDREKQDLLPLCWAPTFH